MSLVVVMPTHLEVANMSKCKCEMVKKRQFVCFYGLSWGRLRKVPERVGHHREMLGELACPEV